MISPDQRDALEPYLTAALGLKTPQRIAHLERMALGQSRAMYRAELVPADTAGDASDRRTVIVRVEQWGLLGSDSANEVQAMQALHAAGYPVAHVLAYERGTELLSQPFFVMDFVEGTSEYTPESLRDYVGLLDRLHRMDPKEAGLGSLPHPNGPRDAALLQVEHWYEVYRSALVGEPSPLVEEAAQWLRNHAPESERISIIHGDPGIGNFLHLDGRVTAVVDWEFVHIGDPDEDWAYLISMRGMGVMTDDEWVAYIEDAVGVRLDPERLHYWQALNFFKAVCIDCTALRLYAKGIHPAPNMLAIGTSVHLVALQRLSKTTIFSG
ncbi:MAG: phosphotransferase family protein [bacterium]|nr:phosphotransferase family protein [bacterium]